MNHNNRIFRGDFLKLSDKQKKMLQGAVAPTIVATLIFFITYFFFGMENTMIGPFATLSFLRCRNMCNHYECLILSLIHICAATFTEDEKFGNIELDMELFRGYVQGYCHEMGRILTAKEKELMVYAVWLMTMESGIHFLTDYLSGDRNMTNFSDERQNLYRAVNQFFLVLDIEEKKEQMDEIVAAVLMKK